MLILIFGLPGTGKSFFGKRLAEHLNVDYINSDQVRLALGLEGKYDQTAKEKVYEEMIDKAEKLIKSGKTVILDATFSDQKYYQNAMKIAQHYQIAFKPIEMKADETIIKKRVGQSRKYSEADYKVYKKIKEGFQSTADEHLILDTSHISIDKLIHQAIIYLSND